MKSSWGKRIAEQTSSRDPRVRRRPVADAPAHPEQDQRLAKPGADALGRAPAMALSEANVPADIAQPLVSTSTLPPPFCQAVLTGPIQAVLDEYAKGLVTSEDEHTSSLARFFLKQGPQLHATREAIAQVTNVPRAKIETCLCTLANAFVHTYQMQRRLLEQTLADSNAELLAYFEVSRYDETPMKVSQRQQLSSSSSTPTTSLVPASSPSSSATTPGAGQSRRAVEGVSLPAVAVISKLFAVESRFTMLVKVPDSCTPQTGPSQYVIFQGTSLSPLHVVERATTECIYTCLLESSHVSEAASQFKFKARTTTTDQAGSNYVAEKAVLAKRPGWSGLRLPRNVHLVANSFTPDLCICGRAHHWSHCIFLELILWVQHDGLPTVSHCSSIWFALRGLGRPRPRLMWLPTATLSWSSLLAQAAIWRSSATYSKPFLMGTGA